MATTNKLLQNLVEGQSLVIDEIKDLKKQVKNLDINLTTRIDKLGLQIASLEDDAPTVEEFDNLVTRVDKIEQRVIFA